MSRPLGIKTVRRQAEIMETETRRFYERAASKVTDASTRELLGDLAEAERKHVTLADNLQQEYLTRKLRHKKRKPIADCQP
jgi:rubrerythrin